MRETGYCLFDTPLGSCGIAWSESGVTLLQLPEATPRMTELRIARSCGHVRLDPPPAIAEVINRIGRHFRGDMQDFRDVALDLKETAPFALRVYAAARRIPSGQTRTYGDLARAVGQPAAARAVGQALGKNPVSLIIPCHRVLAAGGKPGGFSAHGRLATKAWMLAVEGATFGAAPSYQPRARARGRASPRSRSGLV